MFYSGFTQVYKVYMIFFAMLTIPVTAERPFSKLKHTKESSVHTLD